MVGSSLQFLSVLSSSYQGLLVETPRLSMSDSQGVSQVVLCHGSCQLRARYSVGKGQQAKLPEEPALRSVRSRLTPSPSRAKPAKLSTVRSPPNCQLCNARQFAKSATPCQTGKRGSQLQVTRVSENFFADLPALSQFSELTHSSVYRQVPSDWWIVISDIVASTQAIEAGRYKDVNLLGAASIAALKNALGSCDFPFVFGGDGASAAIPPMAKEQAVRELAALQALAQQQFGMHLRIGLVQVDELLQAGFQTQVAKLVLTKGQHIALFRGGGLRQAEVLVKSDEARYAVVADASTDPPLSQLSCRWQPIPSRSGVVLSLLVQSLRGDQDGVYREFLSDLERILGGNLDSACPVHTGDLRYGSPFKLIREERRLQSRVVSLGYAMRAVMILGASLIFASGLDRWLRWARNYRSSTAVHSDYRKFDEMLRMVLDCTHDQHKALTQLLERGHAAGNIVYGLHASPQALMTCLLQSMTDGGHIHFIDGSDGGYAMAAKQLKAQLAKLASPSTSPVD